MITLIYSDGPDALDVKLPDRWLSVLRGESVDVTEEEAALLLILPGWETVPASTPTPEED